MMTSTPYWALSLQNIPGLCSLIFFAGTVSNVHDLQVELGFRPETAGAHGLVRDGKVDGADFINTQRANVIGNIVDFAPECSD